MKPITRVRFRWLGAAALFAALASVSAYAQAPLQTLLGTPLDTDREFSAGSGIALTKFSPQQLETLVLSAKVWGFLKYHHPAVTGGKQHWDFALLRQLPKLLAAPGPAEA